MPADYAIYREREAERPWVVVEVIEEDAKASETLARLGRWRAYGVQHILMAQPATRSLYHRTGDTLRTPDRWDPAGQTPPISAERLFEA
jgi:hypothetical protein